jgi:hypothetical protein
MVDWRLATLDRLGMRMRARAWVWLPQRSPHWLLHRCACPPPGSSLCLQPGRIRLFKPETETLAIATLLASPDRSPLLLQVAEDDVFFHKYYSSKNSGGFRAKKKIKEDGESDSSDDGESFAPSLYDTAHAS